MPFLGFIGRFFKKLFGKQGLLKTKIIPAVIEVVNNVKEWDAQNPQFADLLTAIIPGNWDDEFKIKVRAALKIALEQAAIFTSALEIEDENERIAAIIKQLQSITNMDIRGIKYAEIAAYTVKYIANDGKLDINEIAALTKMMYENTHGEEVEEEEAN